MAKKLEKMKSFTNARFLPFLGAFDLGGFEEGRIEEAQDVPRREEEKGMFGLGELGCKEGKKRKMSFWFLVFVGICYVTRCEGFGNEFSSRIVGGFDLGECFSVLCLCCCVE